MTASTERPTDVPTHPIALAHHAAPAAGENPAARRPAGESSGAAEGPADRVPAGEGSARPVAAEGPADRTGAVAVGDYAVRAAVAADRVAARENLAGPALDAGHFTHLGVRDVPAYRTFRAWVGSVVRVGPSFVRVTLVGDDLCCFADNGFDQRIKLVFPDRDGGYSSFPDGEDWWEPWRALPPERRNPVRTYTARAARPGWRELDVDFALHGDGGPASRWALAAGPGHPLLVIGPDSRHDGPVVGAEWSPPPGATRLLAAGDETAAPALSAIAERLPAHVDARILVEVPEPGDEFPLDVPPGVRVTWLPRHRPGAPEARHGDLLIPAVREAARALRAGTAARVPVDVRDLPPRPGAGEDEPLWEVPGQATADDGFYAWLAGEAGVVKLLRRHLVGDLGVDRTAVAFMGYWRLGRPEID
ncbi:siderophore-interacting protein [Sphaerisporangium aureirubrum]|uniref:Siderophore-interacting protein n=1 Tax=Sphaerisporangium aureirubrum TaxID=1544736 RepID=A0ABW1NMQ6_9ACTN